MKKNVFLICILLLLLTGCVSEKKTQEVLFVTPAPLATKAPVVLTTATPSPTPTPTPTPSPTPTPTPTPSGLCGGRYPDKFTTDGRVEETENMYRSESVSITLTRHSTRVTRKEEGVTQRIPVVYYVADIYIQDIRSFMTAYAGSSPISDSTMFLSDFDAMVDPLLSMNGDFASARAYGVIIRNGKLFRSAHTNRYDMAALTYDGVLHLFEPGPDTVEEILALDPWQAWCFGPSLLDENGKAKSKFTSSLLGYNPRSVLGYYEPGHYCLVVVDGRQDGYSNGFTMKQLAELMEELGCASAYNMDGGGSTHMRFLRKRVNRPSSTRSLSDILYIAEP